MLEWRWATVRASDIAVREMAAWARQGMGPFSLSVEWFLSIPDRCRYGELAKLAEDTLQRRAHGADRLLVVGPAMNDDAPTVVGFADVDDLFAALWDEPWDEPVIVTNHLGQVLRPLNPVQAGTEYDMSLVSVSEPSADDVRKFIVRALGIEFGTDKVSQLGELTWRQLFDAVAD